MNGPLSAHLCTEFAFVLSAHEQEHTMYDGILCELPSQNTYDTSTVST